MSVGNNALDRARQFVPFESKLRPPAPRPGIVRRAALDSRLADDPTMPVVVVVAPAGYGKSTLLATWCERDPRPAAWVSVSESDNDPLNLLTYVALAVDDVAPVAPDAFAGLTTQADLATVLLPRLGRIVSGIPEPCVLVLDDVHLLRSAGATAILRTIAAHLPSGSQLVLGGRREPDLPIARLAAEGRLTRIAADQLVMTEDEGIALFAAAGVDVARSTARSIIDGTEGWPAGLYLAALAIREGASAPSAAQFPADRLIADYLREEVLRTLPEDDVEFLLASSVFDRLSGEACDKVLDVEGSAARLDRLSRANLFVIPLDRTGESYRYHHLFADMLRAEMRRRDPERTQMLQRSASEWWEAQGDIDAAVTHAYAAGDQARVETLMWRVVPTHLGAGRTGTVARWLAWYPRETIVESPTLSIASAWNALTSGALDETDPWLFAAERLPSDAELPDGTQVSAAVALLSAMMGKDGIGRMRQDAARAVASIDDESPWQAVAGLFLGMAQRLLGDDAAARESLEEAVRRGVVFVPAAASQGLGQLALLSAGEGDWVGAARFADRGLELAATHDLSERPAQVTLYSAAALVKATIGATTEARGVAKHAEFLLMMLMGVAPWGAIECRLLLARTAVLLGDPPAARMWVAEAERLLRQYPDPGPLVEALAEVRATTDRAVAPSDGLAVALTPAELRVLRLLPTHLSFGEIADELFVSRNTVKTQAIAVYRKFGVSSRSAAVEHARTGGILES